MDGIAQEPEPLSKQREPADIADRTLGERQKEASVLAVLWKKS